ncbi:putative Peroxisomal membrane protein (Pex16) [Trypanosoma vivax]|nr:hypothetical protein TRVL_06814 [Trypanosoma vivax]KAH8611443.1 putative Peroxisomal membrane protein (Pex16) [Trypanosoma vivax]
MGVLLGTEGGRPHAASFNPLDAYVRWVRRNVDNIPVLERMTYTFAMILANPENLVSKELAWTIVRLHALSNRAIVATEGRRVHDAEKVATINKIIREVECLFELGLRRYCGHTAAWNGLLFLQLVKCCLNLLAHRQMFLVPWMWAAIRRNLSQLLQVPLYIREKLFPAKSIGDDTAAEVAHVAPTALRDPQWKSRAANPVNTTLVIPRVAACRARRLGSIGTDIDGGVDNRTEVSESLPCTKLDILALAVDIVLLVRPLLLLHSAKSVFPHGASDIAKLPRPDRAAGHNGESVTDALFIVRAAISDGARRSLLSNWSVWVLFVGIDALLVVVARYIRRYRVPVVYIKTVGARCGGSVDSQSDLGMGGVPDGEVSSRPDSVGGTNGEHGDGFECSTYRGFASGENATDNSVGLAPPTETLSRDSLRVHHTYYNLAYSMLRDPFFASVLQKFVYDNFVVGRVNRIPLIGSIISLQVAYYMCKQHYCFLYSLGQ